jgi:hypothetical protein
MTTFQQELLLVIIDKVAIGILILLAGFWLNRQLERLKDRQTQQRTIALERREFRSQQLSRFYWPIFLRLQKDRVIWQRILAVRQPADSLEHRLGVEVEKNIIIPNHTEIVDIIENNIHLAQADEELLDLLQAYLNDVEIYKALREAGETQLFSVDKSGDEWWHQSLFDAIQSRTNQLQRDYEKLIEITSSS